MRLYFMEYHSAKRTEVVIIKKSDNFEGVFVIMVISYVILRNIDLTNLIIGDDFDFSVLEDAYA